jgi:chaperonin GroEL (HSP60 family)
VIGGGKALYNIGMRNKNLSINKILKTPMKQILNNAGIKNIPRAKKLRVKNIGVDVRTNQLVNLQAHGILDSYTSIDEALKNASSIACSYLRTNCLIKKGITQNK